MNIKQACLGMIKAFPGGWDAMAGALGYSRDQLENRIYERKGQDLKVHVALQIQSFSGTTLFSEAVALAAGGTFTKLPCVDHIDNEAIADKFLELNIEIGELSAEFRDATAKGEVAPKEQIKINNTINCMHKTMDELRALTFKYYCHETNISSRVASLQKKVA